MLAKRIIPCLDVDKGRVVKGVKFLDIRDAGDPVEVAKRYNEEGADEITFLDITASHEERDTMIQTVERMASEVFIPLTSIPLPSKRPNSSGRRRSVLDRSALWSPLMLNR